MRTIYKYDIVAARDSIIEGPITKLLTAQAQHGTIVLWAEVDTSAPVRKFEVFPIGTGWPVDPPLDRECVFDTHTYLNTVQFAGGNLIFHVYYKDITPSPTKKTDDTKKSKSKNKNTTSNSKINQEVLEQFI